MRHKITITGLVLSVGPRWYVECTCGWEVDDPCPDGFLGRPTWDAALALGVAHQKNSLTEGCHCGR